MITQPRAYEFDILFHKDVEASFRHLFIRAWTREEEDPGNEETCGCGEGWGKGAVGAPSPGKVRDRPKRWLLTHFLYFYIGGNREI